MADLQERVAEREVSWCHQKGQVQHYAPRREASEIC
jgi:hypothetical protein